VYGSGNKRRERRESLKRGRRWNAKKRYALESGRWRTQEDRRRNARRGVLTALAALLAMALVMTGCCFFCVEEVVVYDTVAEAEGIQMPEPLAAEPAEIPEKELVLVGEIEKTPRIVIDPGHGGEDIGCSRGDIVEKEVNLQLAFLLAEKLREYGYEVVLTREDNETALTLEERVETAQNENGDIYVSIHQNACEETEAPAEGIETWYCGNSRDSERLAKLIHKGALDGSKAQDRELRESEDLYVLRETKMPACLVETAFLSNQRERTNICDLEYQEKLVSGIAQGIEYYFHPRTMYLTFDDGPSEENTEAVLDILKANNIRATFFVIGENVRKHPEMARRIVEEGHTIGIHCNTHEYDKIYADVDSYLADFQEAWDAVYEVTGVEAQLFRFPGGSVNAHNELVYEEIIAEMTARGYVYFDWNASFEDAVKKSSPEQLVRNAVDSTLGRKKVVMLAHDVIYNTTLSLQEVIDSLPEYRMEPLTADVKPIQF